MAFDHLPAGQLGAYGESPNTTSWGGNAIIGDDGLWHLFVSEMADDAGNFCGLDTWTSHSRIVHATSKTPLGPYTRRDVALKQEAHNASPMRGKDGKWYIFHIGTASGQPVSNCSEPWAATTGGGEGGAGAGAGEKYIKNENENPSNDGLATTWSHPSTSSASASSLSSSSFLHSADSPEGPWTPMPGIRCNNPAPLQHTNGTWFVGCNDGGFQLLRNEGGLGSGKWVHVLTMKFPPSWGGGGSPYVRCEDPYLYMNARGWHFLSHNYDYRDGWPQNPNATLPVLVAGHGYSEDGINWHFGEVPPYNSWADYADGSRKMFATMERPHLVFDAHGNPTHLLNGVSSLWDKDRPCFQCDARPGSAHSCVVCKTSKGYDWTYTLVRPLKTAKTRATSA